MWNLYDGNDIDPAGTSYAYKISNGYLSNVIKFIDQGSLGKVYIDPDGQVHFRTAGFDDNTLTLSTANGNVKFSSETIGRTNYGIVKLYGGYINGVQITATVYGTTGDRSLPYELIYPNITDQTLLTLMATEILSKMETGLSSIMVVVFNKEQMQYGQTTTLDLSNMSSEFEVLGTSQTMYINSVQFNPLTESSQVELVTSWLYDNKTGTMDTMQEQVDALAHDVQTNGNYLNDRIEGAWTQNITNAAENPLNMTTESYKRGNWTHSTSTNPEQIFVPTAGVYQIEMTVAFATNATGNRYIRPVINGVAQNGGLTMNNAIVGDNSWLHSCSTHRVAAGEWIGAAAYQNSGGTLNGCGVTMKITKKGA